MPCHLKCKLPDGSNYIYFMHKSTLSVSDYKKKSKTKTIRNGKYLLFKTTLREKIYEFTSFPSDFIFLGSIFVSSCSQYALTIPKLWET